MILIKTLIKTTMWDSIKNAIISTIKANDRQEITGPLLQQILLNLVSNLGANYTFGGLAVPSTNPGITEGPVFYLASTPGTYANFGGVVVPAGKLCILKTDVNGDWTLESVIDLTETPVIAWDDLSSMITNRTEFQTYLKGDAPLRYKVMQGGYVLGMLDMIGDNMGHTVNQVLTTNLALENGILTGAHIDGMMHIYYRTIGFNSPHIAPDLTWTPWKDIRNVEVMTKAAYDALENKNNNVIYMTYEE